MAGRGAVEHVRRGGTDHLMGWPEAVRAVTADDVKRVALEYLDPAAFVTVVAGPLREIRAARHSGWPWRWTSLRRICSKPCRSGDLL